MFSRLLHGEAIIFIIIIMVLNDRSIHSYKDWKIHGESIIGAAQRAAAANDANDANENVTAEE